MRRVIWQWAMLEPCLCISPDWKSVSLAPLCDVSSTTYYEGLTRTMGMAIGSQRNIDKVSHDDFLDMARDVGVSPKLVDSLIEQQASAFRDEMEPVVSQLESEGVPDARAIAAKLSAGVNRRLRQLA